MNLNQFRQSIINELQKKRIFGFENELKSKEYDDTVNKFYKDLKEDQDFKKNTEKWFEERLEYFNKVKNKLVDKFRNKHGEELFKDHFLQNKSYYETIIKNFLNKENIKKPDFEEAKQIGFEKVIKIKYGYKEFQARNDSKIENYLGKVIKNAIRDFFKSKDYKNPINKESNLIIDDDPALENVSISDGSKTAEEILIEKEDEIKKKKCIELIMEDLTAKERLYLDLYYDVGLTQFQAGKIAFGDTSENQSTGRHRRLMNRLRIKAEKIGLSSDIFNE